MSKPFLVPINVTVPVGTAPLQVQSTTMVANLNAEMVGGKKVTEIDSVWETDANGDLMPRA